MNMYIIVVDKILVKQKLNENSSGERDRKKSSIKQ